MRGKTLVGLPNQLELSGRPTIKFLTSCKDLSPTLTSVLSSEARYTGSVMLSTASTRSSPIVSFRLSFSSDSSSLIEVEIPVKKDVSSSMDSVEVKSGSMIYVMGRVDNDEGVSSESERVRVMMVCKLCFSCSQLLSAASI